MSIVKMNTADYAAIPLLLLTRFDSNFLTVRFISDDYRRTLLWVMENLGRSINFRCEYKKLHPHARDHECEIGYVATTIAKFPNLYDLDLFYMVLIKSENWIVIDVIESLLHDRVPYIRDKLYCALNESNYSDWLHDNLIFSTELIDKLKQCNLISQHEREEFNGLFNKVTNQWNTLMKLQNMEMQMMESRHSKVISELESRNSNDATRESNKKIIEHANDMDELKVKLKMEREVKYDGYRKSYIHRCEFTLISIIGTLDNCYICILIAILRKFNQFEYADKLIMGCNLSPIDNASYSTLKPTVFDEDTLFFRNIGNSYDGVTLFFVLKTFVDDGIFSQNYLSRITYPIPEPYTGEDVISIAMFVTTDHSRLYNDFIIALIGSEYYNEMTLIRDILNGHEPYFNYDLYKVIYFDRNITDYLYENTRITDEFINSVSQYLNAKYIDDLRSEVDECERVIKFYYYVSMMHSDSFNAILIKKFTKTGQIDIANRLAMSLNRCVS